MLNSFLEALMYSKVLSMLGSYLKEIKIDSGYQGIPIARLTMNADEPARIAGLEIKAGSRKKRVARQRSYYPSQRGAWAHSTIVRF